MILILFMVITGFTLINMLLGVICEIVKESTEDERQKILTAKVEEVFRQMDADGSGSVSKEEFEDPATVRVLNKMGIDKAILEQAMDIMGVDEKGGFSCQELMILIFKLLRPPESQDVLMIHSKLDKMLINLEAQNEASSVGVDTGTASILELRRCLE